MSTWIAEDKSLSGADFILMEDGSYLLQENSDKFLQEQTTFGDVNWNEPSIIVSSWSGEGKTFGASDFVLLEDGFYILQENNDKIVIEGTGAITWNEPTRATSAWSQEDKSYAGGVLGTESLDILITESGLEIEPDQSEATGLTWSTESKS